MAKFTYSTSDFLFVDDFQTDRSAVDVYGLKGLVKTVSVDIDRFEHGFANDVDLLLVGPDGERNLVVMSDAGGPHSYGGISFSFADNGLGPMGDTISAGTAYKPTDNGTAETADNWGLTIPTIYHPTLNTGFTTMFGATNGNGEWAFYMHDDYAGDYGSIRASLNITTQESFGALVGTDGDDIIRVTSSNDFYSEGTFQINNRPGVSYSGVFDWSEDGGAGNDLILAGSGANRISGGTGRDSVYGGNQADYITVAAGDDTAGEVYDGGAGANDHLTHTGYETLDLRDDTVHAIEFLDITAGGTVEVNAAQLAGLKAVTGGADLTHPDVMAVTMGASTFVDLGVLTFNNFANSGDMIKVEGDADDEYILGSKVNDLVNAGGGDDLITTKLGQDTVNGGKGSDTVSYLTTDVSVRVALDTKHAVTVKLDGLAKDTIRNVENITGGSVDDILKGDKLANVLKGSDGADKLKGLGGNDKIDGGIGADKLWGGEGKDQFTFASTVDAADHIKDFSHADDTIVLDNIFFAAFGKEGAIKSKMFHVNDAGHDAHTAKQKLIYDKADHSLWYDADGNGAGAAVEVAVFDNHVKNLDFHDFLIV